MRRAGPGSRHGARSPRARRRRCRASERTGPGSAWSRPALLRSGLYRRCSAIGRLPALLVRQCEPRQARRTGLRAIVSTTVRKAGQNPRRLTPGADRRPPGGADFLAGSQLVDQLAGRLRGLVVHELPVDHYHRREVAGGVALDMFEGDRAVVGGLVVSDPELFGELGPDRVT